MADLALRILLQAQDMASSVVKNVGGSLDGMGGSAASSANGLAMAASGAEAVAGAILSTIQPAANFQTQMTSLVTGAGEAQSNLAMVSSGVLQMATDTGTSTAQLASGMYQVESAGFHGADGLKVLQSAAEGAKVGNANLTAVSNGLTTALTDYHEPASQATAVTNDLIATVANGKTTMDQLSASLANILPVASSFGVSLGDTSAAMATMTGEGVPAAQAATYLRQTLSSLENPTTKAADALTSIGLKSSDVAAEMKKSLPDTLQMITDALAKKFPVGSQAYNAALANIAGGSKQLQGMLDLTGTHLQTLQNNVTNIAGAVKKGGDSITGWSLVQNTFNQKMAEAQEALEVLTIKIGTALLPAVTQIVGAIGPVVGAFSGWIDKLNQMHLLVPILGGVLAGCAALILATVVPAMWSLAVATIAATWPFALIAAAIAGVVAAFLYFYNNSKPFKGFVDGMVSSVKSFVGVLAGDLKTAMGFIGAFLQSTFLPVWKQLQDTWNSQILPSVRQLIATFNQVKPELTVLAEFIGGVLVVAFGLVVGAVSGFVKGIAGMISGLIEAVGGIIQFLTGLVQFIMGTVSFIVDLFTGQWGKLGGDLKVIWGGIANMFQGFGNTIKGVFDGLIKGVTGEFSGFAQGITGYFNQILHGADNNTKAASISTQTNTAEMKDKSIANAQMMSEQTQMKLIDMRNGIEDQLKQTTNAAQKHTLEMKLNTVNNTLGMAQATGKNIVDMREKSLEQVNLLKQGVDVKLMGAANLAKYHALDMKGQYLDGVEQMDTQTIQKLDHMRQGIESQLSQTTDAAKKKSLEAQLAQVTHAENTAKQVAKQHVQMRANVDSEMDKLKKSASDKFGSIQQDTQNIVGNTGKWIGDRWSQASKSVTDTFGKMGKGIQDAVGSVVKWIEDKWNSAVNKVVGFFEYLYKHSRVFQNIVDAIHNAFTSAVNFITSTWRAVSSWLVGAWNDVVKFATDLWGKVSKAVSDAWNKAVGFVQSVWKSISDIFTSAWDTYISKPLTALWKKVSGVFSSAWNTYIAGPIGSLWTSITSTVGGWVTTAETWGGNLIKSLAKGITDAVSGALHTALTGAANAVKNLIGWHSPTKEGPGADSNTWAPNLVKMMSTGLEAGVPQIQNAVNKLAKPIALTLGVSNSGALNSLGGINLKSLNPSGSSTLQGGSSSTTNNGGGTTVVNNYITVTVPQGRLDRASAQQLAKIITDEMSSQQRRSGNLFTNTSGGRT
jgi:TP901 family phage tail tape measure protein